MARLVAGQTVREVAGALSVAPSGVVKWAQRLRAIPAARHQARSAVMFRPGSEAGLRARMAEAPFTLRGLVAELAMRGLRVDYHTMWNFAHAEGLSFKKNRARQWAGPAGRGPQAPEVEGASGRCRHPETCFH